jgi:S-formylglutathione hydrolase FrmB
MPALLRVRVIFDGAAGAPTEGRVAVAWFTRAEWTAFHDEHAMAPLVAMFPRVVTAPARVGEGAAPVVVTLPDAPTEAAVVFAVFDGRGRFFDTLLGAVEGNAVGDASVTERGATVHLTLQPAVPARPERCAGERYQLLTLDAPEVAGTIGNPTARRLCAYLPSTYATQPARRYPVVYVLPGLSSTDAMVTGGFGAIADAVGREAIYVGVDTSTRAGSSYLVDSPRTGAWERFLVERAVGAVDGRLRTIAEAGARAAAGHSTGGFDAVSIALRHPEVFGAVGASSPDGLDLEAWMLGDDGRVDPLWLGWMRVEDAMGGSGQFASYGADWSPDASEARGFAWPVNLTTGAVIPAVWARWRAQSPVTWLATEAGLARARRLAGRMYLTCGRRDEARLFEPTERFHDALVGAGVAHVWAPTDYGHLGQRRERWVPMLQHITGVMTAAR